MALKNGFPAVSGAANFLDIRRDLAGLVARDSAGQIRTGIFPRHFNSLFTARANMQVDVGPFEAVVDRDGAVFLAHEGTSQITIDAAPAANSRIDVIYIKQNETRSPFADATNGPVFGVLKGQSSLPLTKPTNLPAGAVEIGTVTVPAGATATNSSGVVIATTARYTAAAGGTLFARTAQELDLFSSPADYTVAFVLADETFYLYNDDDWIAFSGAPVEGPAPTMGTASWTWGTGSRIRRVGKKVTVHALAVRNSPISGAQTIFTLPVGYRPSDPLGVNGVLVTGGASGSFAATVTPDGKVDIVYLTTAAATSLRLDFSFDIA